MVSGVQILFLGLCSRYTGAYFIIILLTVCFSFLFHKYGLFLNTVFKRRNKAFYYSRWFIAQ